MGESTVARWRNARIGFIFQSFNLIPVSRPRKRGTPLKLTASPANATTAAAPRARRPRRPPLPHPRQMSGGQEQRVAIARALHRPTSSSPTTHGQPRRQLRQGSSPSSTASTGLPGKPSRLTTPPAPPARPLPRKGRRSGARCRRTGRRSRVTGTNAEIVKSNCMRRKVNIGYQYRRWSLRSADCVDGCSGVRRNLARATNLLRSALYVGEHSRSSAICSMFGSPPRVLLVVQGLRNRPAPAGPICSAVCLTPTGPTLRLVHHRRLHDYRRSFKFWSWIVAHGLLCLQHAARFTRFSRA
jgi:hypothetical protein